MGLIDGGRGSADAQVVPLEAHHDRNEPFERGQISIELSAKSQRIR
jgi:hypothetical protein